MRPHEPGRSSGRAPRPQGAAVGRTAGKVAGAGRRLRCRQRMAVTWSFKGSWPGLRTGAGLAGHHFVKSGPRQQCRLCRQAKAELRPQGPFPQIITSCARRNTRGRMTRARRGNAVLAHSCANLNGHFARNGDKRA